jgi:DNA polymerase-4
VHRAIVHVDMDAFYASVEQRDDPSLRGRPLIVGGHPKRGVVLAASYEVRPFGVRSAMPMSRALQLAPKAVVVPPRPGAYAQASEKVFEIFARFTPLIEPLSLDEAFLDVTASLGLFGPPGEIARRIRQAILDELQLKASAGIAPVKFVAKIASDVAKPNGQREVSPGEVRAFLEPLPVGRLWGVGPKLEERLHGLGLRTIGDLARAEPSWLERKLGNGGLSLRALSFGEDPREVVPDRQAKSIGAEDTFEEDLAGPDALEPHIHRQALRVGRRLRQAGVKARVIQLKLKLSDFTLLTRRTTLPSPTDDGQVIYRAALELLARELLPKAVRLTGVSAQELGTGGSQLGLFSQGPSRSDKLNAALDRIAEKFGTAAVLPADVRKTVEGRGDDDAEDEARRSMGASRLDPKQR